MEWMQAIGWPQAFVIVGCAFAFVLYVRSL